MALEQLVALADLDRQIMQRRQTHQLLAVRVRQFLGNHQLGSSPGFDHLMAGMDAHDGESLPAHLLVQAFNRAAILFLFRFDEGVDGLSKVASAEMWRRN